MAQRIEPKTYTPGGRTYNAVGQGAATGFRSGILGGLAGFATAVLGGAAIGALAITGIVALGALTVAALPSVTVAGAMAASLPWAAGIGATIGGLTGTAFSVIPTAIGAGIGGAAGFMKGSSKARGKADLEQSRAREQMAYRETANAIVAQQLMGAQQQPMPAVAANDNPYHQAASQIDASTIAHQQTLEAPGVEQARG